MLRGALKTELKNAVDEHVRIIRNMGQGKSAQLQFSGAYIGLHLRHKWEFKLQPPKLIDVATLVKATAQQINPFAHLEIEDSDPTCFSSSDTQKSIWGPARTVVFCASDEVETCQLLQTILGEQKFYVHAIPNLKLSTGREGILSYLLDVALLEKSAVFIGSGASNLSRLVNALRGPEKLSISMDIDFNTVHF